ncbi:Uncharacterised protein [Vibrio cholerae]|nr:Uncharacterised protein [Vibrio cholerae]
MRIFCSNLNSIKVDYCLTLISGFACAMLLKWRLIGTPMI